MAADKIVSLEFNVNTDNAVKDLNAVTSATKGAAGATKDYEAQLNAIRESAKGGGFKDLNSALKQYRDLALQAGAESPIGKQALQEAGQLKDQLSDLRTTIATTGQDGLKLKAALQLGSGIAAGFGAVQGAMALLGGESEDLQKVLVKLQAAQTAVVAIEEIRSVLEKESALRIVATTIAEKARAAATALATAATNTGVISLRAFKIALAATGVGALVVGLGLLAESMGLFGSETEDAAKKVDGLNKSLDTQSKLTEKLNSDIDQNIERQVLKAKIAGQTEEEIKNLELKAQDERIKNLRIYSEKAFAIRSKIVNDENATQEQKDEVRKKSEEADKALDAAMNKRALMGLERDLTIANKKREDDKAKADASQKLRDEEAARLKKFREDRVANEKKLSEELADDKARLNEQEKKAEEEKLKQLQENTIYRTQLFQEQLDAELARSEREKQEAKILQDTKINLALQGFQLIAELANLNENKSKEAAKRAFNLNKAFQITQATIEGYRAVLSTYAETPGGIVLKSIAAGIAGSFAALKIAAIAKTQFNSAKFDNTTDTGGGAGIPRISTTAPSIGSQSTILKQDTSTPQPIKAYVVESEITKTQKRVNSIIETASI